MYNYQINNEEWVEETEEVKLEEQFIIRFPEDIAHAIVAAIEVNKISKKLSIHVDVEYRSALVVMNKEILQCKLYKLPTIIESYKTTDKVNFYKTATIHEMLICSRVSDEVEAKKAGVDHVDGDFVLPHGLTPPTRNIRNRYRKHLKKKSKNGKQTEQETLQKVKQLIRADLRAHHFEYALVSDDGESDEDGTDDEFDNNDQEVKDETVQF